MAGHGTRVAYYGGCRCEACTASNRAYERARTRRKAQEAWGVRPPRWVDSDQARAHIAVLRSQGLGVATIADRAGVPRSTITRLVGTDRSRPARRLHRDTMARILAVTATIDDFAPGALVDAGPWLRRAHALIALGYTQTWIAEQLGWTVANIGKMLHGYGGQTRIKASTARALRDLYNTHAGTPGPSQRARQVAARYGWLPPLAWDDIDTGTLPAVDVDECAVCVDVVHLLDDDLPETVIARRLGWAAQKDSCARGNLRRHLTRCGRRDLIERLNRRREAAA